MVTTSMTTSEVATMSAMMPRRMAMMSAMIPRRMAMMSAIGTSMGMCSLCPAFRMLLLVLLPDRSLRLSTLSRTTTGWLYSSVQFPIEEKSYERLTTLGIRATGKGPDDTAHAPNNDETDENDGEPEEHRCISFVLHDASM